MADIVPFDSNRYKLGGSGDGPEDPMLEQRVARLESDLSEVKAMLKDIGKELIEIKIGVTKLDGKFEKIDGRFVGLEGRLGGLDTRISGLPATWTILGIVFTTWALGSGILIFAMNFLKR
ncbi:hypothetical protein [Methylosinus sp. Ce-a6]|uniref:hypothetical protein n=1 Tax=Methylosinus sp. Ce-a6 TaxID=2172005 RepID=UPI001FCEF9F1|nr:hypothetical protein [Methylosinus sp. Ce-a6]